MELTKEEKHSIYVSALYYMENTSWTLGLCRAISFGIAKLNGFNGESIKGFDVYDLPFTAYDNMELFPEVEKYRPEEFPEGYWFPLEDQETRKEILREAIKLTQ